MKAGYLLKAKIEEERSFFFYKSLKENICRYKAVFADTRFLQAGKCRLSKKKALYLFVELRSF